MSVLLYRIVFCATKRIGGAAFLSTPRVSQIVFETDNISIVYI